MPSRLVAGGCARPTRFYIASLWQKKGTPPPARFLGRYWGGIDMGIKGDVPAWRAWIGGYLQSFIGFVGPIWLHQHWRLIALIAGRIAHCALYRFG